MSHSLTPIKIDPLSPIEIFIEWNDHRKFSLPYFELRFHCPCAGCVDEHTGKRTLSRTAIKEDISPTQVHQVGRYAIQFVWSDGHDTGMYHFDRLLELCEKHGRPLIS